MKFTEEIVQIHIKKDKTDIRLRKEIITMLISNLFLRCMPISFSEILWTHWIGRFITLSLICSRTFFYYDNFKKTFWRLCTRPILSPVWIIKHRQYTKIGNNLMITWKNNCPYLHFQGEFDLINTDRFL